MQNGTGEEPHNSTHPTPYGTPEGDIVVFFGDRNHYRPAPLNTLTDGTSIIAAGTVDAFRLHGHVDSPRATFILMNPAGQSTYASLSADAYEDLFAYVVEDEQLSVHGIVRRPFEDGPPYIQVTEVEPYFG